MSTGRYQCRDEGCVRGSKTGHALYRTSPKGEPFEGACERHYPHEPEPLAQIIERDNHPGDRP